MIPISDANPSRRIPLVTWLLIGINIMVFMFELSLSERALDRFIFQWGVVPQQLLAALAHPSVRGWGEFATLITSQFIHGGWAHLIGNMLFLYIFGDNVEDVLGGWGYLIFYLGCGVLAGLLQVFALAPFLGRVAIPSIGASGAIAGVLGAYMVLYPNARVQVLVPLFWLTVFEVPALWLLGLWFIQQFLGGLAALNPIAAQAGGVGFWAHIGGFVAGAFMILPFRGRARHLAWMRRYRQDSTSEDLPHWWE